MTAVWSRLELCMALVATVLLHTAAADSCCAQCLRQGDPKARTIFYDPVVHLQCSAALGICCYGCSFSHGSPAYQGGVSFDSNSNAQTTAGTSVSFTFNGVSRITYDFLAVNQAKRAFVGNESTSVVIGSDGLFVLCARSPGTLAFRGWGSDSCKEVTQEYNITVAASASGTATCEAAMVKPADPSDATKKPNQPVVPHTGSSKSGENDIDNCSATRGVVRRRGDGSEYCECLGDWRNPPMCDEYSWTKTILTVLGAVATVLSIAFSVRAYLKSKKSEKEAEDKDLDIVSENELETMRVSPAKRNNSSHSSPAVVASPATTVGAINLNSSKRSPARTPLTTTSIRTSGHETTL